MLKCALTNVFTKLHCAICCRLFQRFRTRNNVAILIGHNPGFEELLAFLTGEYRRMPTCALAKIKFDVGSWKDD